MRSRDAENGNWKLAEEEAGVRGRGQINRTKEASARQPPETRSLRTPRPCQGGSWITLLPGRLVANPPHSAPRPLSTAAPSRTIEVLGRREARFKRVAVRRSEPK